MTEAAPELAELLRRAIESRIADVNVSMPGTIVSYDAARRRASVKPGASRVLFDEDQERVIEELPILVNVPVCWPGGAALDIHGVLAAGDTGDLIFSSVSQGEWLSTGEQSAPGNLRLHSLGAAKFYPGLSSDKNLRADTDNSVGVPGGVRAHFASGALRAGPTSATGADAVVLAGDALGGLYKLLNDLLAAGAGTPAPGNAGFIAAQAALALLLIPDGSLWRAAVASSTLKAHP